MRRLLEILLIAFAVLIAVTPIPRDMVERVYSRTLYPLIQPRVTELSNQVSFPLFDVLLLAVLCGLILMWIVRLRRAPRGGGFTAAIRLLLDTAAIVAVIYFWFLAMWGLNYQREPVRTLLDFDETRISAEALHQLAVRDVDQLNALYRDASRGPWPDQSSVPPSLDAAFARGQQALGIGWHVRAARPKRSLLDLYFRRVAVDGMTDPFFLETLTNQSLLPFERPFVIAHEWSHLAGYADESEANFLAWLICARAGPPEQYSGWISLYGAIVSALPRDDGARVAERLQTGPRNDLRAMRDRVSRQVSPAASRAGYAIYDRFLKANRVEAGIRSYNEVLRLLLGTKFNPDGTPVRQTR